MTRVQKDNAKSPSPRNIRQIDAGTLGITWTDGHEAVYSVRHLRLNCPCANCIDEWTGDKRLDPASVPADVRPTTLKSVGLYAMQFFWSDGHDTGLYSHELMRKLCQCAECK